MAKDLYLDINGISRHIGTDKDYNERNYGAGLTLEREDDNNVASAMVGGYKNSLGDNSYYLAGGLGRRFKPTKNTYIDAGLNAGLATGYGDEITPMLLPYLSVGLRDLVRARVMYGMETEKNPAVLMMNLGIPIK